MEFGRRLAVERELEKTSQASTMNAGIKYGLFFFDQAIVINV